MLIGLVLTAPVYTTTPFSRTSQRKSMDCRVDIYDRPNRWQNIAGVEYEEAIDTSN